MNERRNEPVGARPIDAYLEVMQTLWPAARPSLHREAPRSKAALRVLPHAAAPRMVVPVAPPIAAARAMSRFSSSLRPSESAKRISAGALLLAAGQRVSKDVIEVDDVRGSLQEHLSGLFDQPVSFSLTMGKAARMNRKPVLQVFGARGQPLGFAKIGLTPFTRGLIEREAEALGRLAAAPLPASLETPRVLHRGAWGDSFLLVMSHLGTSPWQDPRRVADVPRSPIHDLYAAFAGEACSVPQLPVWSRWRADIDRLDDEHHRRLLDDCLDQLAAQTADHRTVPGAWHGDWTPWNMSRRRGRVQLWDFERFETGVPPLMDACHYGVFVRTLARGLIEESFWDGLTVAVGSPRVERPQEYLAGAAYLVSLSLRYLMATRGQADGALARRTASLSLECLVRWLRSAE